jgi:hypothetical protein
MDIQTVRSEFRSMLTDLAAMMERLTPGEMLDVARDLRDPARAIHRQVRSGY